MRGDGFAAADSVNAFVGLGFEMNVIDGDAQSAGEGFAHFRKVRTQLRLFQDDDGIDVLDGEVFFVEQFLGVLEKKKTVRAFPFWIGVRKMRADIAETSGAEHRVTERMRQNVAVGVSDGTFVKRKFDSADDQLAPFREPMKIVTNAAAHAHVFWRSCSR